ncbi:cyclic di-GMP phosphodiesterase Gmr [mine drainage metagenome]|uniref:Cyclic di-GMP phosphodiesterase Gmr n=1 Tax=mine drainage metagenome TaxID=410659 RepID=A0A1J5QV37_9ZZZZ
MNLFRLHRWASFVQISALALLYLASARLGLHFFSPHPATLVWSPAGLALAALLIFGRRLWPGVLLGAFMLALTDGVPAMTAVGMAVGSTLEALLGAWLLERTGFDRGLNHSRDVWLLVLLGAGLSTWAGALVGIVSLAAGGLLQLPHLDALLAMAGWWMGDALSVLVFAPLLLAFSVRETGSTFRLRERGWEAALLLLLTEAGCLMVFFDWKPIDIDLHLNVFVLLPFLVWAAIRFQQRGVAILVVGVASFALWGLANAAASPGELNAVLVDYWLSMAILAPTGLFIAVAHGGRLRIESALRETEADYRELVESSQAVIWRATPEAGFTFVSREAEALLGYPLAQWTESPVFWEQHMHPDDRDWAINFRATEAEKLVGYETEYRMRAMDGRVVWLHENVKVVADDRGRPAQLVGIMLDITARKESEAQLRYLANHDALTGLANRTLLQERIDHALQLASRHGTGVAVMFIDLDRFKIVNDTLGHQAGDRLLQDAAKRLRSCLRDSDTIARQGGDEFVVLVEQWTEVQDLCDMAGKVLHQLCQPFTSLGQEFHVSASIGISVYPQDGSDANTLLKNADVAMYRAKEQGRNTFQFYAAESNIHSFERLALENSLRRALERKEFEVYYQPKVDAQTQRVVGAEALLRWKHPELGMVSPVQFIPMAEDTGLIISIGAWVLQEACCQARAWHNAGLPLISVAVNLSARQFRDADLPDTIANALAASGLTPSYLELEITESMIMQGSDQASQILQRFRDMGTHVSIDDFGTGYSSLSYLKHFPIDTLKIDRSFVQDLPQDADDAAITQAIIAMAHSLKLHVVAEGVENVEQYELLRAQGCDQIQGYLFSKPLPAEAFAALLA